VYIGSQTLATKVDVVKDFADNKVREVEIDDVVIKIVVTKNK